jgi:hypothetical protein
MQNNRRMWHRFRSEGGLWKRIAPLLVWLAYSCLPAQAATVTASVDRPAIALGELITLSLTFEGVQLGQPALPTIPNLRVAGRGSSLNMDITRGVSQQTFTYQLAPTAVGNFTIPPMQFNAGGQILRTPPVQFKVLQPGAAVTPPGGGLPAAFVKLITPKKQLYVGEVSEVEVQVYFAEGRITQYPQLAIDSGVTAGKWLKPVETRVNLSNQIYGVVTFKQPFTPVKAGLVNIGPATASVLVPDQTRRADIFFGRPEREVRMATEKSVIQVLPVPDQNVPPTYAGAVGQFTLSLAATPTNVAAGDPITVRIKIAGRGALDAVRLPAQPDWTDFKTYPATSQIEGGDPNNNSGMKTFEQVVVPERPGIKALPPFAFSFFDPDQKMFRTVTTPMIALSVGAPSGNTAAMPSLPGGTNAAPAQPGSEFEHIKPHLGSANAAPLLLAQPWFLGLQLIPPAAWLGLLAWRKHRERLENNPRARRRAEVAQRIRRGLVELREHATAKNSEAFFGAVMRLLQEQIGERVDLPANAITEAVIEERLRPAGAPEELRGAVQKLFQACNLARYAPVKSGEELSALVPELEKALRELQQWEPRRP